MGYLKLCFFTGDPLYPQLIPWLDLFKKAKVGISVATDYRVSPLSGECAAFKVARGKGQSTATATR